MKPVLFHIPGLGLNVYSSGFMIGVGFLLGLLIATRRSRQESLNPETISDLGLWLLVGGLLGARLFYVVDFWGELIGSWSEILQIQDGGLVLHGAFLGGAIAFSVRYLLRPFPILATLDAIAPSVALGMAVGRVGCLLNGCCYGKPCELPGLGLQFPPKTPAWLGERARALIPADALATLPLHPTQIYLMIEGAAIFAILTLYYPRRRRDGEVFGLLLWIYPISHFIIDILRDDEGPAYRGLTMSQLASLLLLAIASVFWSSLGRRPENRLVDNVPKTP